MCAENLLPWSQVGRPYQAAAKAATASLVRKKSVSMSKRGGASGSSGGAQALAGMRGAELHIGNSGEPRESPLSWPFLTLGTGGRVAYQRAGRWTERHKSKMAVNGLKPGNRENQKLHQTHA